MIDSSCSSRPDELESLFYSFFSRLLSLVFGSICAFLAFSHVLKACTKDLSTQLFSAVRQLPAMAEDEMKLRYDKDFIDKQMIINFYI
jgi:hypothetical protein